MRLSEAMRIALEFWPASGYSAWLNRLESRNVPTYEGLVRRGFAKRVSDMDGVRYRLTPLGLAERERLGGGK